MVPYVPEKRGEPTDPVVDMHRHPFQASNLFVDLKTDSRPQYHVMAEFGGVAPGLTPLELPGAHRGDTTRLALR